MLTKFEQWPTLQVGMRLGDAPCWGAFTFKYQSRSIHVPAFLNSVARYKPDSFWNWLIKKEDSSYIVMTYQHLVEEELQLRP